MSQPSSNPKNPSASAQSETTMPEFVIQQIFVKDVSFETPNRVELQNKSWQPNIDVELNASTLKLNDALYQVQLSLTTTAKIESKTAFLVEVHQVGVFTIKDFPEPQLHRMLGSYCPNILFPYAREVISDMVTRGGFPPLYLAPINFDLLYDQQMQKQRAEKKIPDNIVAETNIKQ